MSDLVEMREVEGLGPVEVCRSSRSRTVRLTVSPRGEVRVAGPSWRTSGELLSIVRANRERLERVARRMREKGPAPRLLFPIGQRVQWGRFGVTVEVQSASAPPAAPFAANGFELTLRLSPAEAALPDQGQATVRRDLDEFLLRLARRELPPRLGSLADALGVRVARCTVRAMRTRWGSCSTQAHISLNAQLARLPESLADFVMLHELAHLVHPDHSPAFHGELDQWCRRLLGRGEKELWDELRRQGIEY